MLELTDSITNEVLETITFLLAYPTVIAVFGFTVFLIIQNATQMIRLKTYIALSCILVAEHATYIALSCILVAEHATYTALSLTES